MSPSSRVFIVGNGPSLNNTNLDLLIGEESWSSGRIDLLFPHTDWRPTRGFWGEWPKGEQDVESIRANLEEDYPYWMRSDAAAYLLEGFVPMDFPSKSLGYWKLKLPLDFPRHPHLYGWCGNQHAGMIQNSEQRNIPVSWHLPYLCRFGSTTHIMLQQAVVEGYKEIYLIGTDLGFTEGESNHFAPDYQLRPMDARRADQFNRTHVLAHTIARWSASSAGATIVNATVGGDLEVYPRVEYASLL